MSKVEEGMCKKRLAVYETPTLHVLVFEKEDVLTASPDVGGEWPGDWGE